MTKIDLGIEGLSDFTEIGSGGFATVYAATEAEYGRRVAVKVLTAVDDDGRRRFDRERLTMGQASSHPNIVTPLRGGYTDPGNQPYLVMEFLAGGSLEELAADGPLPWSQAVALIAPIADALNHAHRYGIIHKDIKPANILLARSQTPKLSDFGIAAITDRTHTSQVAYTLAYAPPETFTDHTIDARDHRSDTYSLAATLYTLGTGNPPFTAATTPALINQILSAPPSSVGNPELDAFFAAALHKDPDRRHQSADQLHTHLQQLAQRDLTVVGPIASSEGATVQADPPAGLRGPAGAATTGEGIGGIDGRAGADAASGWAGRRLALVGGAVAALVVAAIGLAVVLSGGDEPTEAAATATTTADETATTAPSEADATDDQPVGTESGDQVPRITDAEIIANHTGSGVVTVTELGDGRIASGGTDGTIRLWDPADPTVTDAVYTGHTGRIDHIVGLDDGRIVSAASGGAPFTTNAAPSIHIWDPDRIEEPGALYAGHLGSIVYALVELPDGRMASAGFSTLQIWDPDNPEMALAQFDVDDILSDGLTVDAAVALPDGRIALAAGSTIDVWDPSEPLADVVTYAGHGDEFIRQLTVTSRGRVVSAAGDVHVWDPADGSTLATWSVAGAEAWSVTEVADGRILIGDRSGAVHTFDPEADTTEPIFTEHTLAVSGLQQLSDARIASASFDGTVRLWRLTDPSTVEAYDGHVAPVDHVLPLADGRIASSGPRDLIRVWALDDPGSTIDYENPALNFPPVYGLSQLDDGRVQFSSTSDGALHLWDPADDEAGEVFEAGDVGATGALIQLNDGRVIGEDPADEGVRVWSLDAPEVTEALYPGHNFAPEVAIQLTDGRIASGDFAGEVHVWDPADPDGEAAVYLPPDTGVLANKVEALAQLPDGRILIGTELGGVNLWDPANPAAVPVSFRRHTGTITGLLVFDDGTVASASVDGTVQIWDPADLESPIAVYDGHTWVSGLARLDDGRIISAGGNGIHLWVPPNG